MSDLVGNPEDRFSRVAAHPGTGEVKKQLKTSENFTINLKESLHTV